MTEPERPREPERAAAPTAAGGDHGVSHLAATDERGEHCAGSAAFDYVRHVPTPAQELAVKLLTQAALRWHSADSVQAEASRGTAAVPRGCLETHPAAPIPVDPADSTAVAAWRNEGDPN
jgi:hypothetical protein